MQRIAMILTVLVSLAAAGCSSETTGGSCPAETPATCGNGVVDPGETCDQGNRTTGIPANFAGQTCTSLNNLTTGALQCGCCSLVTDLCVMTPMGGVGG